jgi:hypothetical protein
MTNVQDAMTMETAVARVTETIRSHLAQYEGRKARIGHLESAFAVAIHNFSNGLAPKSLFTLAAGSEDVLGRTTMEPGVNVVDAVKKAVAEALGDRLEQKLGNMCFSLYQDGILPAVASAGRLLRSAAEADETLVPRRVLDTVAAMETGPEAIADKDEALARLSDISDALAPVLAKRGDREFVKRLGTGMDGLAAVADGISDLSKLAARDHGRFAAAFSDETAKPAVRSLAATG